MSGFDFLCMWFLCACRKKDVPVGREKALKALETLASILDGREDGLGWV